MLSTSGFDFTGCDFHEVFKTYEFKKLSEQISKKLAQRLVFILIGLTKQISKFQFCSSYSHFI